MAKRAVKEVPSQAPQILQSSIIGLVQAEETLKTLRRRCSELGATIEGLRHSFILQLDTGQEVEKGRYTLGIRIQDGQIRPPWKDLYLSHFTEVHSQSPAVTESEARKKVSPEKEKVLVVGVVA